MQKDFEIIFNNAVHKAGRGENEEAISDFTKLLETNPDFAPLYYNRGISYRNINKLDKAIEDYNNAINISPHPDYYYARGLAYYFKDKFSLSLKDYDEAVKLDSDNSKYYYNRGIVKLKIDKYYEAIDDFTKAISIDHQISDYYYNRACAFGKIFEFQKAISDATKAIELKPQSADAYFNRGLSKIGIGSLNEGFLDLMKAGELGNKEAYDIIDKYKNDKGDLQIRQIINPNDPKIYFDYAIQCMESKEFSEAIIYFTKVIELDEGNVTAYYNRGFAKEEIKDYEGAEKDYKKCNNIDEAFFPPYNNLGVIYLEKGNYPEAINIFTKAINFSSDPNESASAYSFRGLSKGYLNDYIGEIKDYEKSIQLDPKRNIVYYNLAIAYYHKGNQQKSKLNFQIAAQLGNKEAQSFLVKNKIEW